MNGNIVGELLLAATQQSPSHKTIAIYVLVIASGHTLRVMMVWLKLLWGS